VYFARKFLRGRILIKIKKIIKNLHKNICCAIIKMTIIMVTCNPTVAAIADSVVLLVDEQIRNVRANPIVSEINPQIMECEN